MNTPTPARLEEDSRFPSGPWVGFFLQPDIPGRHAMELHLTFSEGKIRGEGRDRVGSFFISGRYTVEDGKSWWTKSYVGRHDVSYSGFNEGKGIWGTWDIYSLWKGGFHIWPEAMGDPMRPKLSVAEELPAPFDDGASPEEADLVTVGVGASEHEFSE